MKKLWLYILISTFVLANCGGGGGGSSTSDPTPTSPTTYTFDARNLFKAPN